MSQSLAELGWRTFNFFTLTPARDPTDPSKKATFLQGIDILCWAPGNGYVIFGEPKGAVFQLEKSLDIRFFKVFKQRLIHFALAKNLLVAIGDDADDLSTFSPTSSSSQGMPVLKIWDLSQWNETVAPKCKHSFPLNLGRKIDASKASVVAVSQNLSILVVGLSNSSLFYAFGDWQKDRPKFRSLRDGSNILKSGHLVGIAVASIRDRTIITCITEKSLNSYILGIDGNLLQTAIHDAEGCERNCWFFSPSNNQLLVSNRDMVYFYNLEDCLEMGAENGRCHALSRGKDKIQLLQREGLVALLTEQDAHIQSKGNSKMTLLNIYDIEQRYIAFFCSMPSPCHLFLLDSDIYLLNSEGVLCKLVEENLNTKLEILLKKNLFDLAISIVRQSRFTTSDQCKSIYMKYGDYLYTKGDFDNAMKQYTETIGHVEPSKIIKKFLDGTRISQLCFYLETLHNLSLAIGEHTTLLISAYVKLNSVQKLNQFIDQNEHYLVKEGFDADAAIKLLRSAQLYRVAAKLALKCQKPDIFIDILTQDTKEFMEALRFIEKLPASSACNFLQLYGSLLLENIEDETIKIIRKLIAAKEENHSQLVKMLMSRPSRMEEIFTELNISGQLQDVHLRNALLEQRLKRFESGEDYSKQDIDEILQLIGPDNSEQALLLEKRYKCPPLVMHILRLQNRKEDLLRYLLNEGNIIEIIELCGEKALREMWIDLIGHVCARPNKTKKDDLIALLKRISQSDLLHPLVVLEMLSKDDSLQVGDIRDYIVAWLERQNAAIKTSENKLSEQQKRLEGMNAEIDDLENNVQVFQVSKCAVCNNPLQVPSIHFLCRHSYHANCFESYSGNSPDQCPACTVSARKNTKEQGASTVKQPKQLVYQQFKNELENCPDAMALISEYIASGAFNIQPAANAPPKSNNPFDDDNEDSNA
uniref:Vacuolar protein sorting-associated protein 11 homolog n=1 Tax=Meloidogyne incognita TaxID=6306 RepID=A0A914M6T4_MELIC